MKMTAPADLVSEQQGPWAQVGPLPQTRRGRRLSPPIGRLALGLAVAATLAILGRTEAALLVAVLALVLAAASDRWERVDAAAGRVVAMVGDVAGTALSFLTLGTIKLLVFAPASIVLRLARHDPLAHGSRPGDNSFWHPHDARNRRSLHRRQYTYEVPVSGRRGPMTRLATAVGAVALLLATDVAVGAAVSALRNEDDASAGDLVDAQRQEPIAAPDAEWWPALEVDTFLYASSAVFDPLLGWRFPDFSSASLNVSGGDRRSYVPPSAVGEGAVEVAFYGGSTAWGAYQRDEHTIPSEVARLAEADGLPVRVVNRGQPAYAIWQEIGLLEQDLSAGMRPDVVVLYNGINEQFAQAAAGPTTSPTHLRAAEHAAAIAGPAPEADELLPRSAVDAYLDVSVAARGARLARSFVADDPSAAPREANDLFAPERSETLSVERGRAAVALHARAVEVVEQLAVGYGFEVVSFWQPHLYTKEVIEGEAAVERTWGETPEDWRTMSAAARPELAAPVIDLTQALDGGSAPVMLDFMHTNEEGARMVAEAMYPHLLEDLRAAGQP